MAVRTSNLLMGPAELFAGPFGAPEPAFAAAAIPSTHRDLGGTDGGATLTLTQTYTPMMVDQVAMAVGSRLTEQGVRISTNLAESTLANLRLARNQGAGTNEGQTVGLGAATAGTFTLTFQNETTAPIAFNANAAAVQTALEALGGIAPGDVVVTGGPLPAAVTVTWQGAYGGMDVPTLTGSGTGLTGGALTITTTTPGVGLVETGAMIGNSEPNYSSIILRGQKPGGGPRLAIIRRALSMETIGMSYEKANKTMIPVTFEGYFVSDAVNAFRIDDRAS
jgi:hypothetical protein